MNVLESRYLNLGARDGPQDFSIPSDGIFVSKSQTGTRVDHCDTIPRLTRRIHMSQELMTSVRSHQVEQGTAVMWWLGQNGFLIRSPRGVTISIDAYLT